MVFFAIESADPFHLRLGRSKKTIIRIDNRTYEDSINYLKTQKNGKFIVSVEKKVIFKFLYEIISAQRLPQNSSCHN